MSTGPRLLHDVPGVPLIGPGTEVRTTICYMCACVVDANRPQSLCYQAIF